MMIVRVLLAVVVSACLMGCSPGLREPDSTTADQPAGGSTSLAAGTRGDQHAESLPGDAPQTAAPRPGDWPRWRGAELDGISRETGWNAKWTEAPPIVWEAEIGTGFSSMSIAGGRLYTMGYGDDMEHVYCFDAETGEVLWKQSYPGKLIKNLHEGGPAATPTVDGDRVYTVGKEGQLHCFTAQNGEIVWSRQFKDGLDFEMPEWGFACSPLVRGKLLIVDGGQTAAYDKRSGELVWKSGSYRPGYGSAVPMRAGGEDLIAVLNNDVLLLVRESDGSTVAATPWETSFATSSTTPIVQGDEIFISTGYNRGCALLKLAEESLEYVYENKNMCNHMANCVLWQGHLYGIDGNAHRARSCSLNCIDYRTGELRWEQLGFGCGSLLIADGKLIVLSDQGELVTAEASPEGYVEISRAEILTGKCWTVPVLSSGRLYARNAAGHLVCVDLR